MDAEYCLDTAHYALGSSRESSMDAIGVHLSQLRREIQNLHAQGVAPQVILRGVQARQRILGNLHRDVVGYIAIPDRLRGPDEPFTTPLMLEVRL